MRDCEVCVEVAICTITFHLCAFLHKAHCTKSDLISGLHLPAYSLLNTVPSVIEPFCLLCHPLRFLLEQLLIPLRDIIIYHSAHLRQSNRDDQRASFTFRCTCRRSKPNTFSPSHGMGCYRLRYPLPSPRHLPQLLNAPNQGLVHLDTRGCIHHSMHQSYY